MLQFPITTHRVRKYIIQNSFEKAIIQHSKHTYQLIYMHKDSSPNLELVIKAFVA